VLLSIDRSGAGIWTVLNVAEVDQDGGQVFRALQFVIHEATVPQRDPAVRVRCHESTRDQIRGGDPFLSMLLDKRGQRFRVAGRGGAAPIRSASARA
jgi:hypothetical protein